MLLGEAYLDTVPRGGSAARGVDREVPTRGSLVRARAEETAGEARGAPLPPGGRPPLRVQECDVRCACRYGDMVRWAVLQTLLELASKKGTETGLVPSEVDPATGDMVFVFTDIMNSTGPLALPLCQCAARSVCASFGALRLIATSLQQLHVAAVALQKRQPQTRSA